MDVDEGCKGAYRRAFTVVRALPYRCRYIGMPVNQNLKSMACSISANFNMRRIEHWNSTYFTM